MRRWTARVPGRSHGRLRPPHDAALGWCVRAQQLRLRGPRALLACGTLAPSSPPSLQQHLHASPSSAPCLPCPALRARAARAGERASSTRPQGLREPAACPPAPPHRHAPHLPSRTRRHEDERGGAGPVRGVGGFVGGAGGLCKRGSLPSPRGWDPTGSARLGSARSLARARTGVWACACVLGRARGRGRAPTYHGPSFLTSKLFRGNVLATRGNSTHAPPPTSTTPAPTPTTHRCCCPPHPPTL